MSNPFWSRRTHLKVARTVTAAPRGGQGKPMAGRRCRSGRFEKCRGDRSGGAAQRLLAGEKYVHEVIARPADILFAGHVLAVGPEPPIAVCAADLVPDQVSASCGSEHLVEIAEQPLKPAGVWRLCVGPRQTGQKVPESERDRTARQGATDLPRPHHASTEVTRCHHRVLGQAQDRRSEVDDGLGAIEVARPQVAKAVDRRLLCGARRGLVHRSSFRQPMIRPSA